METIVMKKKTYKKPTMKVYDLPSPMMLQASSDPSNSPGWNHDFG